ncbi:MAG: dTDP-4-dehydrorhamnose 3,5-epimerase family protein [Burkholderiaceae bacterium]
MSKNGYGQYLLRLLQGKFTEPTMQATRLAIPDVMLIEPKVFGDTRGFFSRVSTSAPSTTPRAPATSLCRTTTAAAPRGCCARLHFQVSPKAQGKLVRVLRGAVFDGGGGYPHQAHRLRDNGWASN